VSFACIRINLCVCVFFKKNKNPINTYARARRTFIVGLICVSHGENHLLLGYDRTPGLYDPYVTMTECRADERVRVILSYR